MSCDRWGVRTPIEGGYRWAVRVARDDRRPWWGYGDTLVDALIAARVPWLGRIHRPGPNGPIDSLAVYDGERRLDWYAGPGPDNDAVCAAIAEARDQAATEYTWHRSEHWRTHPGCAGRETCLGPALAEVRDCDAVEERT